VFFLKHGIVRTFDADKGYGWIVPSDGGNLFVHKSNIPGDITTLPSDARVTYELRTIDKDVEAINVTLSN
jgi:cold shock CspA family protein